MGMDLVCVEQLICVEQCKLSYVHIVQGLTGLTTNPVLANGIAGLATSATAQATVEVSS